METSPKDVKPCKYCGNDIPAAAVKCTHCDTWQNWRGLLNFSIPVLSLILAILTVIFSSGREFYKAVTYTPRVNAMAADISLTNFGTLEGAMQLVLFNGEDAIVPVSTSITCEPVGTNGALELYFTSSEEQFFTLAAKSEKSVTFKYTEHTGDLRVFPIGPVSWQFFDCSLQYLYDGKPYTLTKHFRNRARYGGP